jgi:outer membrane protein TolC
MPGPTNHTGDLAPVVGQPPQPPGGRGPAHTEIGPCAHGTASATAWVMILFLLARLATAAAPTGLDELVAVSLERDPEAKALAAEANAAAFRATAAGRGMDPELMVGVESLWATEGSGDETMAMIGVSQMLRGIGEAKALRARLDLDRARSEADNERLRADLRLRFRQAAARIEGLQADVTLLDAQVRNAEALRDIGLARYGAGALGSAASSPPVRGDTESGMGTRVPLVTPQGGGGGGMPGMGGSGGGGQRSAPSAPGMAGMGEGGGASMGSMTSMGAMGAMGSEPPGLPALLRLDADIARAVAEREGITRRLAGEIAVLTLYVGEEAADAVAASPKDYLETTGEGVSPERRLAEVDRQIATADVSVARTARRPDLMITAAERVMPDGMPAGTDASVGVQVPLWGGRGQTLDAARATEGAVASRADLLDRDLAVATAQAEAALAAADARLRALEGVVVPRSQAAWDVAQRLFATNRASAEDAVRTWEALVGAEREAVGARRDRALREAELLRLEGR